MIGFKEVPKDVYLSRMRNKYADEPRDLKVIGECMNCHKEIYESDTIYGFDFGMICNRCMEDAKDVASNYSI